MLNVFRRQRSMGPLARYAKHITSDLRLWIISFVVGQMESQDYAKKAFQWAKAIRLLDPTVQLISCGGTRFLHIVLTYPYIWFWQKLVSRTGIASFWENLPLLLISIPSIVYFLSFTVFWIRSLTRISCSVYTVSEGKHLVNVVGRMCCFGSDLSARKLIFFCCLSRCSREGYRDHEIAYWSGEDRGWIVEGNNCVCTCAYNPFCRLTASWALGASMNGTSGKFSRYVIISRG